MLTIILTYEESGQTYDLLGYYNMGGGIAVYGGTLTMNEGSSVKNNAVTNTNYSKVTSGIKSHGQQRFLGGRCCCFMKMAHSL